MSVTTKQSAFLLAALVVLIGVGYKASHRAVKTATVAMPTKSYVALGDSVAAGVGLKDESDSSACDRTKQSYPFIVAKTLNYNLTSLACSSASLTEGVLGSQTVNQLALPAQLDALFALKAPDLITITIGANDADWLQIIGKCYTGICGSAGDTAAVNARLAIVTTNLTAALQRIKDHYGAHQPAVFVTGYYQVFPATTTTCTDLTGIDASELAWGRQQQAAISKAAKDAIPTSTLYRYVDIDFSGHELCTSDSWIQSIGDKQVYHPTQIGQAEMAKQIVLEAKSNQ